MSRVSGILCEKPVLRSFDVDDIAYRVLNLLLPALFLNFSTTIADPL